MREPESHVTPEYELWSCEHPDASEDEVVELLGALVRAEKPKVSVEVGAHIGVGTEAIGRALERNGRGHLHSFELDPTRAAEAAARCADLPVTIHEQKDTAAAADSFGEVDFLFVDGHFTNRQASLDHWMPVLRPNALIAVHDTLKWEQAHDVVMAFDTAERIHIVTPRGLTLMRKTG